MKLSRRVTDLKPSATVAVMNRAKEMQRQGVDVVSFAAGEPDFDTPQPIKDAAIKALLAGQTKYMPTMGDHETRRIIADKVSRANGLPNVTPEHIGISAGGKHALYTVMQCLFDLPSWPMLMSSPREQTVQSVSSFVSGMDLEQVSKLRSQMGHLRSVFLGPEEEQLECLLPVPAWVSYAPLAELAGARIVEIPSTPQADFKISPDQLRRAITPRSRVLVLCTPSNPCGTMYTESELRALAAVVDEIYEKIAYGGIPHFSIGSVPEIAERTITLNGLSKAYSMTGWRIGYTATSGEWGLKFMKAMATLQGQMSTNITSFVYPAIRTALTECEPDARRFCEAFGRRAALIHKRMTAMPGLVCPRPTGAFYAFPDISAHFGTKHGAAPIDSPQQFCEALLAAKHVAAVPGEDFGGCARNHVRFSFACSEDTINKGMDRLAEFLGELR